METKDRALLLIDYENLYCSGTNQNKLKLTSSGFKRLVRFFQEKFEISNPMVLVACHFRDYADLDILVEGASYTKINALEKDENITDGYLITYGARILTEKKEEIDRVILVGGDGIYSGLLRLATGSFGKKVTVVSWTNCLSAHLKRVHENIELNPVEEVFGSPTEAITEGWLEGYAITDIEKRVIEFVCNKEKEDGFQIIALARIISKWDNTPFLNQFDQALNFLQVNSQNNGFFEAKRAPGTKAGEEVIWVKLKREHIKVIHALKK